MTKRDHTAGKKTDRDNHRHSGIERNRGGRARCSATASNAFWVMGDEPWSVSARSSATRDTTSDGGGADVANSNRTSPYPMTPTRTQTATATAIAERNHRGLGRSVKVTVAQL
jgi:hypothetical protein